MTVFTGHSFTAAFLKALGTPSNVFQDLQKHSRFSFLYSDVSLTSALQQDYVCSSPV